MIALANQLQRPQVQSYVLKSQAKSLPAGIIYLSYWLMGSEVQICLQATQYPASASQALLMMHTQLLENKQKWEKEGKLVSSDEKFSFYALEQQICLTLYDAYSTCEKPPPVSDFVLHRREKWGHTWPQLPARQAKVLSLVNNEWSKPFSLKYPYR
jgi:hypothetical protein